MESLVGTTRVLIGFGVAISESSEHEGVGSLCVFAAGVLFWPLILGAMVHRALAVYIKEQSCG